MANESNVNELRLLLEELCCELCLFEHCAAGWDPREVQIEREFPLGPPGAFADIRVAPAGLPPYFVEVKWGYTPERLISHLARKYGARSGAATAGTRIVLLLDNPQTEAWAALSPRIQQTIGPGLAIETWNEKQLLRMLGERFGVSLDSVTEGRLLDAREAIERAKGLLAFGSDHPNEYRIEPLAAELLWHFDYWRLRELRVASGNSIRGILPPGHYEEVAVVFADLCSFSSFVRDTTDAALVRHCLTSFYSKARHQIVKQGGMLYQFVGDAVVGLFGIPHQFLSWHGWIQWSGGARPSRPAFLGDRVISQVSATRLGKAGHRRERRNGASLEP